MSLKLSDEQRQALSNDFPDLTDNDTAQALSTLGFKDDPNKEELDANQFDALK